MPDKISSENPRIKETSTNNMGDSRLHGTNLGDVWAALTGQNPASIMPQIVATVLQAGGTRPVWKWQKQEQEYILMAWPQESPIRAAVLMAGPDKGDLKPVSAVPLLEGTPNDLTVEEVVPRKEGLGADVGTQIDEGQNPLWFYDPLYSRDKDDLTCGVTHTFWLAGAAYGIRRALLDHVTIARGPQFEEFASKWLEQHPDKTRLDVPPFKIDIRGKRIVMPGKFYGEYEIRSVIEEIEEWQFDKMPIKVLHVSFPFDNRPALRLPIYVSQYVLKNYVPEKGQEIDAYIWLEGRIVDLPSDENM